MPAVYSIDDVYKIINYALNINQQGNLPPDKFNLIINQASYSYFRYLLGEYQKYQPGRPIATPEPGQSSYIRESLSPFIEWPSTLTIDGQGRTPYPTDYEMWDAMYWGIYKQPVKFIQQGRLSSHINSSINPVSRNPVFMSVYRGFQVYPTSIGTTELSYIRTPQTMTWAYSNDIYGRPQFNAALSQNPQWQISDMWEVIVRALAIAGVNLQAQMVSQYANMIKQGGQ